jgi:hypothetical protein
VTAAELDPAAVAAASAVASSLLGGAGQLGAGPGGQPAGAPPTGGMPTGGMPPVPTRTAVPSTSRYSGVPTAVHVAEDGTETVYLRRRPVPQPEALATLGWERVPDGDRVDLLAARAVGDPAAFWRLADAALVMDVSELEQPGRAVRVALPQGFPGAPGA